MAYNPLRSSNTGVAKDVVKFPDLKPRTRNALMSGEIGTQFDMGQRLFAYYGDGDVFLPPTTENGTPAT